jgi:acyl transferase domain-containing protein/phosphopantetheinyl transferase (holo-ACP synthase)
MPSTEQQASEANRREPIAIVGMDCIFPGAANLAAFWRNVVRGASCFSPIPLGRWRQEEVHDLAPAPGGFIADSFDFDPLAFGIVPTEVGQGDPEQFLVLSVIERALRDMKDSVFRRGIQVLAPERTELVIGRGGYIGNGPEHLYLRMDLIEQVGELLAQIFPAAAAGVREEVRKRLVAGLPPVTAEVVACAMPNLVAGRAANRFNVMGRNYTVDAACASSLVAVDNVVRSLRERRCDLGIAAGVHLCQKPGFWLAFQTLGAMSRSGVCRPFAGDADGLLMGEGIGAVVLKRLSDAVADGDRVYAAIRAAGVASDGRGAAVMNPRVEGQILALRRAYEEAGIDPQRVTLVEGHGTATVVGDSAEIDTLHSVLGKDGPSAALGSVKSMIGHAMPAAGMAGLIKAALAVYHRLLPPTLNVERVNPKLEGSRFAVNTATRPWVPLPGTPRTAAVNAFGFGGINVHVILEEAADGSAWQSLTPQSSELFLAGAEGATPLAQRLRSWLERSASLSDEDLADACYSELEHVPEAPAARLAIVASSMADWREKLERALARLAAEKDAAWLDPSGIYFGLARYNGQLAFLFPGIGFPGLAGGYTARLAELYLHFPEIRKNLDTLDELTQDEAVGPPFSHLLFPPPLAGREAWAEIERQLAWSERSPTGMAVANMASWDLLQLFGIQPDAVAGFSLGELSALFAAGVIDRDRFYAETYGRLRKALKETTQSSGAKDTLWGMVGASVEQAEAVLNGIAGDVAVTMDVGPAQVFIGGEQAAVRAALERFQEAGIWAQALPVFPLLRPFLTVHTEMAGPLEEQMREIARAIELSPGKCQVYSGTSAMPYPQAVEDIRGVVLASVTGRVRFRDTIARLYADGVRIFVQMGAGGKMVATVESTLAGWEHVALSTDVSHRGGLEQLHHVLGRLAALGVPWQWPALYRYRLCRSLGFEKPATSAKPGTRRLSLLPPRIRLSADSAGWIRKQLAGTPAVPGVSPAAPPMVLSDVAPGFSPARRAPLPDPIPRFVADDAAPQGDPTPVAGQALMERFLHVQQAWEATENSLMQQFLETQARAAELLASAEAASRAPLPDQKGSGALERYEGLGQTPPPPLEEDGIDAHSRGEARPPSFLSGKGEARPFLGEIRRFVPGRELESHLVLDLSQHLFLSHHAFLNIPDGLKAVEERLPTLPLTFELEILAEAAEALGEGLRVTGCHDLEARRWVSLESRPTLEVTICARRVSETEVEAEILTEGESAPAFRGCATLGAAWPVAPAPLEQSYDRECPHTAAEFYATGPFFHGPLFHLIRSFRAMSERDIGAELTAGDPEAYLAVGRHGGLIFEPVLLDALQQIVGYRSWLDGWYTMPIGLRRIQLYGSTPAPGSAVRASVQYRRLDGRRIDADYEAYDEVGRLWMRVEGLQGWRVLTPKTLMEANHRPREGYLARPGPVDDPKISCYGVHRDQLGDIKPEWIARLYLRETEWAAYRERPAVDWLLGRIAAKDAVRDWLRRQNGTLLHPLEVEIVNEEDGAPRVVVPAMSALALSIAHLEDEAIAVAGQAPGVGVDLALLEERGREFSGLVFAEGELSALPEASREEWIHRAWCAKEAAVKAFRVGFGELPQFYLAAVEEKTGMVVMKYRPMGIKVTAATWVDRGRAFALVKRIL